MLQLPSVAAKSNTGARAVLRPACRPTGKEAAAHIRRMIRQIRHHWPRTEILLRADSHSGTPDVLDLCDTLGLSRCPACL